MDDHFAMRNACYESIEFYQNQDGFTLMGSPNKFPLSARKIEMVQLGVDDDDGDQLGVDNSQLCSGIDSIDLINDEINSPVDSLDGFMEKNFVSNCDLPNEVSSFSPEIKKTASMEISKLEKQSPSLNIFNFPTRSNSIESVPDTPKLRTYFNSAFNPSNQKRKSTSNSKFLDFSKTNPFSTPQNFDSSSKFRFNSESKSNKFKLRFSPNRSSASKIPFPSSKVDNKHPLDVSIPESSQFDASESVEDSKNIEINSPVLTLPPIQTTLHSNQRFSKQDSSSTHSNCPTTRGKKFNHRTVLGKSPPKTFSFGGPTLSPLIFRTEGTASLIHLNEERKTFTNQPSTLNSISDSTLPSEARFTSASSKKNKDGNAKTIALKDRDTKQVDMDSLKVNRIIDFKAHSAEPITFSLGMDRSKIDSPNLSYKSRQAFRRTKIPLPQTPQTKPSAAGSLTESLTGSVTRNRTVTSVTTPHRDSVTKKARVSTVGANLSSKKASSKETSQETLPLNPSKPKARSTMSFTSFNSDMRMMKEERSLSVWINHLLVGNKNSSNHHHLSKSLKRHGCVQEREVKTPSVKHLSYDADSNDSNDRNDRNENVFKNVNEFSIIFNEIDGIEDKMRKRLDYILHVSKEVSNIMAKIDQKIDSGSIKMKVGCPMVLDVKLKNRAVKTLLNFHPCWLKTAFETVLKKPVCEKEWKHMAHSVHSAHMTTFDSFDNAKSCNALESFILQHFLHDSALAKDYANDNPMDGLLGVPYREILGKKILRNVLLLVLILDRSMVSGSDTWHNLNYPGEDLPLLFRKSATIKSTTDIVKEFFKGSFQKENDFVRNLNLFGYRVEFEQKALLEYEFNVRSIPKDLSDGIIFCRIYQILTDDNSIFANVRVPALNRIAQITNCEIFLKKIEKILSSSPLSLSLSSSPSSLTKMDMPLSPSLIADGNRAYVIKTLWMMMLKFQVPLLVNFEIIKNEIKRIKTFTPKRLTKAMESNENEEIKINQMNSNEFMNSEHTQFIFKWIQCICDHRKLKLVSFEKSFFDGVILCHVVNFYMPHLFPLSSISSPYEGGDVSTRHSVLHSHFRFLQLKESRKNEEREFFIATETINSENSKNNFKLLNAALASLNLPQMFYLEDLYDDNPQNYTKCLISTLCFLFSRMMQHRREIRSAVVIQRFWRFKLGVSILQTWIKSAVLIQRAFRKHRQEKIYQSQRSAAIQIQTAFRAFAMRKKWKQMKASAIKIQRHVRDWLKRRRAHEIHVIVPLLQSATERSCARKRHVYLIKATSAVLRIQSVWRGFVAQTSFLEMRNAAVEIQSKWKGAMQRRKFEKMKMAAIFIQKNFRCYRERNTYEKKMKAIVNVQTKWKKRMQVLNASASLIQKHYRLYVFKKKVAKTLHLFVRIQALWRGYSVRKGMSNQNEWSQIRSRIQVANSRWTVQETMAYRTKNVIRHLSTEESVKHQFNACITIEFATCHSYECCQILFQENGFLPLIDLIEGCNRSPPGIEIQRLILKIFLNLFQFRPLGFLSDMLSMPFMEVLTNQIQKNRNNDDVLDPILMMLSMLSSEIMFSVMMMNVDMNECKVHLNRELAKLEKKFVSAKPNPKVRKGDLPQESARLVTIQKLISTLNQIKPEVRSKEPRSSAPVSQSTRLVQNAPNQKTHKAAPGRRNPLSELSNAKSTF